MNASENSCTANDGRDWKCSRAVLNNKSSTVTATERAAPTAPDDEVGRHEQATTRNSAASSYGTVP